MLQIQTAISSSCGNQAPSNKYYKSSWENGRENIDFNADRHKLSSFFFFFKKRNNPKQLYKQIFLLHVFCFPTSRVFAAPWWEPCPVVGPTGDSGGLVLSHLLKPYTKKSLKAS